MYLVGILSLSSLTEERAFAHGTAWTQEPPGNSVAIYFFYSDGTPMLYSQISIFSPSSPDIPFQKGNTDKEGWFVFKPTEPGVWKFSTNDGQGHLAEGEVEVVSPVPAGIVSSESMENETSSLPTTPLRSSAHGTSKKLEIALGLSIILNLTLIALIARKGNKKKESSDTPNTTLKN